MSVIIHRSICPACSSNQIHPALNAVDYTVTKNTFSIWHCNNCSLRFTQGIPDINGIGAYYQSHNYISHSDTKAGFINRLYHVVRNFTLGQKYRLVKRVTGLANGCILDIGAGTGAFAHTMQLKGWKVSGLEPDSTARTQAQKNHALQLDTPDAIHHLIPGVYDAITLWHVLEHVHELDEYWNHFSRLLNGAGSLIIAVPNYTSSDASAYGAYWAAYDVPRHLYHFSPAAMEQLGLKYGFIVKEIRPMWFDSFYVSMLSEQYKNGHSNLLAACWQGLISNIKTVFNHKKCSSVIYIFQKIGSN